MNGESVVKRLLVTLGIVVAILAIEIYFITSDIVSANTMDEVDKQGLILHTKTLLMFIQMQNISKN